MKPNPYPDVHGAPVHLPDTGEIVLSHEKHEREIIWMAEMFWKLVNDLEMLQTQTDEDLDNSYDEGFEAGMQHGSERRRWEEC